MLKVGRPIQQALIGPEKVWPNGHSPKKFKGDKVIWRKEQIDTPHKTEKSEINSFKKTRK